MKEIKHDLIIKSYLLLKSWWEKIDLTNYEKNILNHEIVSFNQHLFRLKEKKLTIGIYGKAGVGKSSILNQILNKDFFKTNILNGSTKKIKYKELALQNKLLDSIELMDTPGFDSYDIDNSKKIFSDVNESDLILFVVTGDLNRNELSELNNFIKNGREIILIINKIDMWELPEINTLKENINKKLPQNITIPVIVNSIKYINQLDRGNNIQTLIKDIVNDYGKSLLISNSFQAANKLFLQIKQKRLIKRKKEAQTIIGKFATLKASGVALNPFIIIDIAGSFALDTALIIELSKVYGLSIKGKSARKLVKKISINNIFLGATQIGINTSFNLLRKLSLITAPLTNGISLLSYGPVAFVQAAIAVKSTKLIGKLAAREILRKNAFNSLEPLKIIQEISSQEYQMNYRKFFILNQKLDKDFSIFLP